MIVVGVSFSVKEDLDKLQRVGYCASSVQGLIGLFSLVWFIIGNIWLYSSDDCASDWLAGYVITLIFLILGYIAFALICCLCCCLICGVGVLGIAAASAPQGQAEAEPLRGVEDTRQG
jgi:apolipoprotein N-acyltransferase